MIYITTSNGIYYYDEKNHATGVIMNNKYRPGFFKKKSRGFFGIGYHQETNSVVVASREKLGTPKAGKSATDTGIHAINATTHTFETIDYIKDLHDVHQLDVYNNFVLLTDTGKNRVFVYDLNNKEVTKIINIGSERYDINHVNAVTVYDENIYIGLNNRGHKDSEIMIVPVSVLSSSDTVIQAEDNCSIITLTNCKHTHDIEPYKDTFLVSVSHESHVISTETLEPVIHGDSWTRGLAISDNGIWLGQSLYASRSRRHVKKMNGVIVHIDPKDNKLLESVTIEGAGQINDLLRI